MSEFPINEARNFTSNNNIYGKKTSKQGIKKELTVRGHKAEALGIIEKGNFFDKKKIIIIKIEDKIYTAAITTSEKGTLISFI